MGYHCVFDLKSRLNSLRRLGDTNQEYSGLCKGNGEVLADQRLSGFATRTHIGSKAQPKVGLARFVMRLYGTDRGIQSIA